MTQSNSKEHERSICYLTYRDLKECGSCGLLLEELERDDNINRKKKHGKICECGWFYDGKAKDEPSKCPECKGHRRLKPLLVVDHSDGTLNDDKDGEFGKNLRWLCMSCNRKLSHTKGESLSDERPITREKRDSIIGKPGFINYVVDCIRKSKEQHVCQKTILNAPFQKKTYSIITKTRWLDEFIWTELNQEKGKFDSFTLSCESPLCGDQHIAFHGLIPKEIAEQLRLSDEIEYTNKYYS